MALLFRSHWSQEEDSGLRLDDVDGNHLTIYNEAGHRLAKLDTLCQYGTNYRKYIPLYEGSLHTRLEIPELYGVDFVNQPWSGFVWFYSDVPFTDNFLMAKRSDTETTFAIRVKDGTIRFETSSDNIKVDVSCKIKPTIQQKHFIGVSYNPINKRKRIYYDGVLYESVALHSNTLYDSDAPFTLGALSGGGRSHEGWIDQTGILPLELSINEWNYVYNNGNQRCYEDYVASIKSGILHNKLELITLGNVTPAEYIGIVPGAGENDKVPGTKEDKGFTPHPTYPLPPGYTWSQPNEYIGIVPGAGENDKVPGTKEDKGFTPHPTYPLPPGYTWSQPNEYIGIQPEELVNDPK